MVRLISLVIFVSVFCSQPGHAQVNSADLLDKGPLRLGAGLDAQFTRFGRNVLVTANSFATVRGVQSLADALIPTLNKKLICYQGRKYGGTLESLTLAQNAVSGATSGLQITANVHVTSCGMGLVNGNIAISSNISPLVRNSTVQLAVSDPNVQSLGVRLVGFSVPERWVSEAATQLAPPIHAYVNALNLWLAKQFTTPAMRRLSANYKLQVQTAQIGLQNGDLVLNVVLSGQVPSSNVDRLLNF